MIKRSDLLMIFGLLSLTLAIITPHFELQNDNHFTYAIIFFTGSLIIREIENKK